MPLCLPGVPAGSPACTAVASKRDEFVMLRCRWEGGMPPATLRWWDSRGQALGVPMPSAAVLVLSADASLGGQDFICVATHPLRVAAAQCHLRLGKPGCPHVLSPTALQHATPAACTAPVSPCPLAVQTSPSWRWSGARWQCWRVVRRGWRAGGAVSPTWVPKWSGTTPRSGRCHWAWLSTGWSRMKRGPTSLSGMPSGRGMVGPTAALQPTLWAPPASPSTSV